MDISDEAVCNNFISMFKSDLKLAPLGIKMKMLTRRVMRKMKTSPRERRKRRRKNMVTAC